jgi:hypothetical protein
MSPAAFVVCAAVDVDAARAAALGRNLVIVIVRLVAFYNDFSGKLLSF